MYPQSIFKLAYHTSEYINQSQVVLYTPTDSPTEHEAKIVWQPGKLPACTAATAHTFAFEFDLVMDLMAILATYEQKCQLERRRMIWQFIEFENILHDQNTHWNHDCMWNIQLDECYLHDISLITLWTQKNDCQPLPRGGCMGKPQQKTNLLNVYIHSTILYH